MAAVVAVAIFVACRSANTSDAAPSESGPCDRAGAHVGECLDELPAASTGACDEARAQQILDLDCGQLRQLAESGQADGSWDGLLCSLGFKSYCTASSIRDGGAADWPSADATTFTFVILADPHIDDSADANHHLAGLNAAIRDILDSAASRNTKLVFVLGDIAWGGSAGDGDGNLAAAKSALDVLLEHGIAYVPLLGDDDVWGLCGSGGSVRCELQFKSLFEPHFLRLSTMLANWKKAPLPVHEKYLQSFSFDQGPVHFIGADFVSRDAARSEAGDLHDETDGANLGTWRWLKQDLDDYLASGARQPKSVVILSHIPLASRVQVQYPVLGHPFVLPFELGQGIDVAVVKMAPLGFTNAQAAFIYDELNPHLRYIYASYAGHLHLNAAPGGEWFTYPVDTYLTHPTWSPTQCDSKSSGVADNWTVRYVSVNNRAGLVYRKELVERVPGTNASGICIAKE